MCDVIVTLSMSLAAQWAIGYCVYIEINFLSLYLSLFVHFRLSIFCLKPAHAIHVCMRMPQQKNKLQEEKIEADRKMPINCCGVPLQVECTASTTSECEWAALIACTVFGRHELCPFMQEAIFNHFQSIPRPDDGMPLATAGSNMTNKNHLISRRANAISANLRERAHTHTHMERHVRMARRLAVWRHNGFAWVKTVKYQIWHERDHARKMAKWNEIWI